MRKTMVAGPTPIFLSDGTCFPTHWEAAQGFRAAHLKLLAAIIIGSWGDAQGFHAAYPKLPSPSVLGSAPMGFRAAHPQVLAAITIGPWGDAPGFLCWSPLTTRT